MTEFPEVSVSRGGIRWDRVAVEGPALHDCETPEPREYWERFEDPEDEPWTCEVCKGVWDIDWGTCHECYRRDEDGPTWYRRPPAGRFKGYTVLGQISDMVVTGPPFKAAGGWCAPGETVYWLGLDIP